MQNEKINGGSAAKRIATATFTSFTICVLCWSVFWLLPDWEDAGIIGTIDVVVAIWVSLGICLCMSFLGFACFSEVFAKKASMLARYLAFSVFGCLIIIAWVLGSGWCPMAGFPTLTFFCVATFAIIGIIRLINAKKSDEKLNRQLNDFKQE